MTGRSKWERLWRLRPGKVRGTSHNGIHFFKGISYGAPHTVEIQFVLDNTDIPKVITTGGPGVKALGAKTSRAWIPACAYREPESQRTAELAGKRNP